MHKLIIRNIKQVVQVCENKELLRFGRDQMRDLAILSAEDTINGFSVVVNAHGIIEDIGETGEIDSKYFGILFEKEIDASGQCLIPGLVDSHTHPVWAGDRVHEFAMKLSGATYMEVHEQGGGINFTVEHVQRATEESLYQIFLERLQNMIRCGTTTLEAKSGYGLDAENEIKMLNVIERAKKEFSALEISSTYCGAHGVPRGKSMKEATDDIIFNQIPKLSKLIKDGRLHVDSIDAFCEKGIYDTQSTKRILEAGKNIGLSINFHGDELHSMQSGELGAMLGARSISHLEKISSTGIKAMAEKQIVAILLPTTAYILRLEPPPVQKMIEEGVPIALGSDFSPNAFCYSMPMVMHLACCTMKMTMEEALIGATINGAASLGLSKSHGSIEIGKQADLLVIDAPRCAHTPSTNIFMNDRDLSGTSFLATDLQLGARDISIWL